MLAICFTAFSLSWENITFVTSWIAWMFQAASLTTWINFAWITRRKIWIFVAAFYSRWIIFARIA
jgi:hypothetical protein